MSNENEIKPARRVEDKRAAVPLDWSDTAQPALAARSSLDDVTDNTNKAVLTDKQISKGARALADRNAEMCGVNKDDNWAIYGQDYIDDFRAAVEASGAAPASADNPSTAGAGEELATLKSFWSGRYWRAVTGSDCEKIDAAFANLAAPVAQSTSGATKGGITSLTRYGWKEDTSVGCFDIRPCLNGQYVKFSDIERLLAAPALNPSEVREGWISIEERLPTAENEDTGRDVMVSDSLFIRGIAIDGGEAIGLGDYSPDAHQPEAGWRCYGGDYDFMHFAKVTHWMKPARAIKGADQQGEQGGKGGNA